jgi:DNA-binding CsgD family transcriptional regulator/tetratricopeptide (TPR) repeat protein
MSHVGPLVCPILVGRDDLLDLADRRIADAAAGRGQFLLLAGEAGVGKTRLLDAIRRKATQAGFMAADGALAPQDRFVPLSLILDLARTLRRIPAFGTLGDDLLAMRGGGGGDELASRRIFVLDVAERLAAAFTRPTLLAFEDLQWADEVSLEVLAQLSRLARDGHVLLLGAYRTDELPVGSILREWRSRLIGQRLVEEARLAPLTRDETALMTTLILRTGLPAPREVVNAVYKRTDGFPLHIEELLGALGEEARRDDRAIRDADVPETIEDAILARVARLSEEGRAVARAGAVIGRCFVPEVLAGIMDRPVADLDTALQELVDNAFLDQPGSRGLYDFRHQLLRDALYGSVPASELRRLHARAGEFGAALEGASEIHASQHFERAGLRTQAYRTALGGARAAAALSSRGEAFELFRRAVANQPDDLPALEIAQLYADYATAAAAVERLDIVAEALEIARHNYLEAGRPIEATWSLFWRASIARREARPVAERLAAVREIATELDALPAGRDREILRVSMLLLRAAFELDAMRLGQAAASATEARALAETLADPDDVLDADATLGLVEILAGNPDAGIVRAFAAAREARDRGLESIGVTAYRNAAVLATRVMAYDAAGAGIREGVRYADAIEQSHCRHIMTATSAMTAWAAGRWDEALETALQEMADRGCRRGSLGAQDALGFIAFGRGETDLAREHLEASLAAGRESDELGLILPALWGLAETDLFAGEPAAALGRCEAAFDLAVETGEQALLVPFVVTGVRAALAANRPDLAERWRSSVAGRLERWWHAGPALSHADGLLRLAAGTLTTAREALDAAVRGWDGIGRAWEASWARLDLAHCLLRANRIGEAASLLAAVKATGERLGSAPLVERADDLARIGRGRGHVEEPWRPLTAREFEVARLIADGLTNGEIADQLTIAPKTASAHVEHILAKLGATRRAEIAAWAATISGRTPAASRAGRQAVASART